MLYSRPDYGPALPPIPASSGKSWQESGCCQVTIRSRLRKGEVTSAAPAIQKVASNANLTPTQKDLIASVADNYAPGLTKAAGTVEQGLQNPRNLGK
jgi:hypothetical protein